MRARSWIATFLLSLAAGSSVFADGTPPIDAAAKEEPAIESYDWEHWAFAPLANPTPPEVNDRTWVVNDIDRFILARLEADGLSPMPMASRGTLIRRVHFDLTGLPPTADEVDAFVADESADAYERLVDRLLASKAYGERWGQHWLDLARYADTDGFEVDGVRRDAWRYRDWVIRALNDDMPYDEFARRQIAGDEIQPGDRDAAVATGFLLCGPDMPDQNLLVQRRHEVLNEMTGAVGAVFLGLQIGCAECHDHKFDPISQADFYRLRSVFEPSLSFETQAFGRVMAGADETPPASHMMLRGDFRSPGPEVSPAFPRIANPWGEACDVNDPAARRRSLAEWLTRPDHPLATRVIVNRLWLGHFGEGLSVTPNDFGYAGDVPEHTELLDWLATELPRRGWSLKDMHRLMVQSATYRQASRAGDIAPGMAISPEECQARLERSLTADPENRLWGRFLRKRLEGEAIRDTLLLVSGQLSLRAGGPGVMPPLPKELVLTLKKGQWSTSPNRLDHARRSVYLFVRRNLRYPIFEAFDKPDTNGSCPKRGRSTTATQALTLVNSELSQTAARAAARIVIESGALDDISIARRTYRQILSREPSTEELSATTAYLAEQTALAGGNAENAVDDLCLALVNINEFVYVD